jgi:hypothetical protein
MIQLYALRVGPDLSSVINNVKRTKLVLQVMHIFAIIDRIRFSLIKYTVTHKNTVFLIILIYDKTADSKITENMLVKLLI